MDNDRTFGMRADAHLKYADVVSGDQSITNMVLTSRVRDARVQRPMFFKTPPSHILFGACQMISLECVIDRAERGGWTILYSMNGLKAKGYQSLEKR